MRPEPLAHLRMEQAVSERRAFQLFRTASNIFQAPSLISWPFTAE